MQPDELRRNPTKSPISVRPRGTTKPPFRKLEASHSDLRGSLDAGRMLRLTSSLQAYHRQRGNAPDFDSVVRYLLHADDLPRSVFSCLVRAEESLAGLALGATALDRARRKTALLRSRLEFGDLSEALASSPVPALLEFGKELAEVAGDVQDGIAPPQTLAVPRSQYLRPGPLGDGAES